MDVSGTQVPQAIPATIFHTAVDLHSEKKLLPSTAVDKKRAPRCRLPGLHKLPSHSAASAILENLGLVAATECGGVSPADYEPFRYVRRVQGRIQQRVLQVQVVQAAVHYGHHAAEVFVFLYTFAVRPPVIWIDAAIPRMDKYATPAALPGTWHVPLCRDIGGALIDRDLVLS